MLKLKPIQFQIISSTLKTYNIILARYIVNWLVCKLIIQNDLSLDFKIELHPNFSIIRQGNNVTFQRK